MSIVTPPHKSVTPSGLFFPSYAVDLLRRKEIKARGVILLAHIDARINPFESRVGILDEFRRVDDTYREPPTQVIFEIATLRRMLACGWDAAVDTVDTVAALRPVVMEATKVAHGTYALATCQRRGESGLFAPPRLVEAFEARTINVKELLIAATIYSFARNERTCFVGNAALGREVGIVASGAYRAIKKLYDAGLIDATYQQLSRQRTRRYLTPA